MENSNVFLWPVTEQGTTGSQIKTYYLIFKEGSPPAITESWKAAQYWEKQGCTIETYRRSI